MPKSNLSSRSRDSSQEHLEENRNQTQAGQVSQTLRSQELFQENYENNQVSSRPTCTAKVKCLQTLTNIIRAERSHDLDVSQERAAQRVAAKNDEQRERRLRDLRQRGSLIFHQQVDSEKALVSIIEIATCPVCYTRLCNSPTVCVNGHAVCSNCGNNLSQCPICSASFSQEKHTILSQILEALPFICNHKGCSILTTELVNHEKWCGYRPTICERCSWSGPAKKLKAHVTSNHIIASNDTDVTCQIVGNFKKSYARLQYGQVFWEITKNSSRDKLFSIQLLWVPNGEIVADVFQMKVEFTSKETSYTANTRIKFNPGNSSDTQNCLVFHRDILENFEDNGSLSYKLYLTRD